MTPEEHDVVVARVSHLPQLVVSALMSVVGETVMEDGLKLAGAGLVDTTRLASSPAGIWQDIWATNADNIRPAIDDVIEALACLRDDVQDGERLQRVFRSAGTWRGRLEELKEAGGDVSCSPRERGRGQRDA
jgi:prephenate dehydrogenase